MVRKELLEPIFKKCLNDKINLFENVSGKLEMKTFADRGSGDYIAEVSFNFGGPFRKKIKTWGYDTRKEAEEESVENAVKYLERAVYPNLVNYDKQKGEITLIKSFREAQ
ncbi:MAG: hypothetical protein PHV68_09145 [Candidatus Gastranaerophilales bacterium]|jgi:hypothetical protein|nr:hypothetical protein [Candidatus Gastranaerophilales bacterium]